MLSRNMRGLLVVIFSLFCAFLFFHPVLFLNKTFFFRDIHRLFYPMKFFLSLSLKSGSIPFWCPEYFCGAPFMSDIQTGVFYPLSLIFSLLPFPWALNVYIAVHFLLAFIFFYLFIRQLGLSFGAGLLTATSYCYGSYIISSVNTLNNLSTAIWLPISLWAFGRFCILKTPLSFLVATVVFAAAILGGEPQLLVLMTVLTGFFFCFLSPDGDHSVKGLLSREAMLCFVVIIAILLTSVQLIPTFLDYRLSVREPGIPFEEAARFSLTWGMLKHLLAPLTFCEGFVNDPSALRDFFPAKGEMPWLLTIYPGLIISPLAASALILRSSRPALFWLITFLASIAFSLGKNTPAYHSFYMVLPFFRFPEKFMFTASFSLLVLAAYGLDSLCEILRKRNIRTSFLVFLLAVILLTDLYLNHGGLNPTYDSGFYQMHSTSMQPIVSDKDLFRTYVDSEPHDKPAATIAAVHFQWQQFVMPNLGMLFDLSHVDGQSGMELKYQYFITELLDLPWKERIRFLKLANVKYIVSPKPLDQLSELKGEVERVNDVVYRIKNPMPRAWIVGKLQPVRTGTIDELVNGSVDFSTTALTKGRIIERHNRSFFNEAGRPEYHPGRIRIEVTTDEAAILVVSEAAYPGWKVWMDGKEVDGLWLNLLFQGVELPAGRHEIEFVFRPLYFFASLTVSALTFFTLLFVCLFPLFRRSRG
ncbi:MAG: hypothetical protein CVU64_06095 [Deltaproteobacteria bacterium HGW-Deltaproteobacteria-21]|nr:MAG: hypothetical protein CVU64_06095 [Deltaproteobacteria bacterium HGW-Deltaproteobacteria-21]